QKTMSQNTSTPQYNDLPTIQPRDQPPPPYASSATAVTAAAATVTPAAADSAKTTKVKTDIRMSAQAAKQ
ncbi:hypothetical protein BGZ47_001230, partial [Haplosporangium gracile]